VAKMSSTRRAALKAKRSRLKAKLDARAALDRCIRNFKGAKFSAAKSCAKKLDGIGRLTVDVPGPGRSGSPSRCQRLEREAKECWRKTDATPTTIEGFDTQLEIDRWRDKIACYRRGVTKADEIVQEIEDEIASSGGEPPEEMFDDIEEALDC
jgi:hypothetical protein